MKITDPKPKTKIDGEKNVSQETLSSRMLDATKYMLISKRKPQNMSINFDILGLNFMKILPIIVI